MSSSASNSPFPPYTTWWTPAQRHFHQLMESDAIVRPFLLAQLREQDPACADLVTEMLDQAATPLRDE